MNRRAGRIITSSMPARWDYFTLANHLEGVLRRAEDELRLEQAVYGLDWRDELQIHTLLADGLQRSDIQSV